MEGIAVEGQAITGVKAIILPIQFKFDLTAEAQDGVASGCKGFWG